MKTHMVPHSRIAESSDKFGAPLNTRTLLVNSMEKWRVILCVWNFDLGEVNIRQVLDR